MLENCYVFVEMEIPKCSYIYSYDKIYKSISLRHVCFLFSSGSNVICHMIRIVLITVCWIVIAMIGYASPWYNTISLEYHSFLFGGVIHSEAKIGSKIWSERTLYLVLTQFASLCVRLRYCHGKNSSGCLVSIKLITVLSTLQAMCGGRGGGAVYTGNVCNIQVYNNACSVC